MGWIHRESAQHCRTTLLRYVSRESGAVAAVLKLSVLSLRRFMGERGAHGRAPGGREAVLQQCNRKDGLTSSIGYASNGQRAVCSFGLVVEVEAGVLGTQVRMRTCVHIRMHAHLHARANACVDGVIP